jgi:hypothetical protein
MPMKEKKAEVAPTEEKRIQHRWRSIGSRGWIFASTLAKGKTGAGRGEEGVSAGSRPPLASPAKEKGRVVPVQEKQWAALVE